MPKLPKFLRRKRKCACCNVLLGDEVKFVLMYLGGKPKYYCNVCYNLKRAHAVAKLEESKEQDCVEVV